MVADQGAPTQASPAPAHAPAHLPATNSHGRTEVEFWADDAAPAIGGAFGIPNGMMAAAAGSPDDISSLFGRLDARRARGLALQLQRSMGNRELQSVVRNRFVQRFTVTGADRGRPGGTPVQRHADHGPADAPTAPAPPTRRPEEREDAAAALPPEPATEALVGGVRALKEDEQPTRAERDEKRAQSTAVPLAEEDVSIGGGGLPVAGAVPVAGAFVDGGRADTVRFGDADEHGLDGSGGDLEPGAEDLRPRIFIAGGKTGSVPWGGGAGAGPHGNQESGSAELVVPEIETSWGGVFTNSDAWVKEGTGTVTVKRDYVSSSPGDQGNGWYITDKAAAGLERHEQRHVAQSRDIYIQKLQPALDRIINSYSYGKDKVYKSADAAALVQRYVDWAASVKGFDEDDKAWNGKGGQVDQEDQFSPTFPRQIGPGKVNGKDFENRLKMPTEDDPPE